MVLSYQRQGSEAIVIQENEHQTFQTVDRSPTAEHSRPGLIRIHLTVILILVVVIFGYRSSLRRDGLPWNQRPIETVMIRTPTMGVSPAPGGVNRRHDAMIRELKGLENRIKGDVYFREDYEYEEARTIWCLGYDPPLAVIEVADEPDVQEAIRVLARLEREYSLPFRIRSGGHHKAGFSSVAGGAVLSLRRLNQVSLQLSSSGATARMGPGFLSGQFTDEIIAKTSYGGVYGFCESVAESGFALGGGIGMQSRRHGLGLDNIESMRVVLADGSLRQVSATDTSSSDLFWALRGAGGGNFGVVTEIDFRLYPNYQHAHFMLVSFRPEAMAYFMFQLGSMELNLPWNLCLMLDGLHNGVPDQLQVSMLWTASTEASFLAGEEIMTDLVNQLSSEDPISVVQGRGDLTKKLSDVVKHANMSMPWSKHVWKARAWCGFLFADNNTLAVWNHILSLIIQGCTESSYLMPDIELWGGAIHEPEWNATAFPYRDAIFNVGVLLMVPPDIPNADQLFNQQAANVNVWWRQVQQYLTGSYVNYPTLNFGSNYPKELWGDNLPGLVRVKQKYDPDNIFQFPLNVPISL